MVCIPLFATLVIFCYVDFDCPRDTSCYIERLKKSDLTPFL